MATSISIILDQRRMKQTTGTFPIKLLVVNERKPYRYQTIFDLSAEDYHKLSAPRINIDLQNIKDKLKGIQTAADIYLENNTSFSLLEFERDFILNNPLFKQKKRKAGATSPVSQKETFDLTKFEKKFPILNEEQPGDDYLSTVYISYITRLLRQCRIGSALNYQDSYFSMKTFGGNLRLAQINDMHLMEYEQWMRNKGRSKSTVGIKLRPLRAIFNYAIDGLKVVKRENCYPFGRYKYLIPTSRNTKKSLERDVIGQLYNYSPECEEKQRAKDYWFFCYFGNGMNPKDIAYLKYKNIEDDYITFERAKTALTNRTAPKLITVFLTEELIGIIDRWGNKNKGLENYIFPVIEPDMEALEQHFRVKAFVKFINDGMNAIRLELGLKKKIRTMEARHSFSTQLKLAGASTEFIQESLGHADKKTTENYLSSFEKETKKEFAQKLRLLK